MPTEKVNRTPRSRKAKIAIGAGAGAAALAFAGGLIFSLQPRTNDSASPEATQPPAVAEAVEEIAPAPAPAPASDLIAVPDLTGMTSLAAKDAVDAAGLQQVDFVSPDGIPQTPADSAHVISQSVPAGTRVAPGAAITVTVESGNTALPNLVGMSSEDAKTALRTAGFDPESVEWITEDRVQAADLTGRTVVDQYPPEGTAVNPGDFIEITVR